MAEKKDIEEKLSDFERKGNHWLELVRNWIIEANQAKNFVLDEQFFRNEKFYQKNRLEPPNFEPTAFCRFQKAVELPLFFVRRVPRRRRGRGESFAKSTNVDLRELNPHCSRVNSGMLPLHYRSRSTRLL